jgi:hypothetical protein
VSAPTIQDRLARRLIVMSTDPGLLAALDAALPEGWSMTVCTDLDQVGEYQDVLLHRFLLLDLDESAAFDPLAVIGQVRVDMLLNLAIFCFGGDAALRDRARLARADRFFERGEIVGKLPVYCDQYGW